MLIDTTRFAAVICRRCSHAAITPISPFELTGRRSTSLMCASKGCESECAAISYKKKQLKITVKCAFCGGTHTYTTDAGTLWKKELSSFPCPDTGIAVFLIGSQDRVTAAFEESLKETEKFLNETLYALNDMVLGDIYDDLYDEDDILYDILDELDELRKEGSLSCICGNEIVSINPVNDNSVLLSCPRCRRSKMLDANEATLSMLINATAIIIGR